MCRFCPVSCVFIYVHLWIPSDFFQENMRIKIIGENNCARATRHLLRMAGFAVTEFLPAEVVTQAPHSGYAITIETSSPAGNSPAGEKDASARGLAQAFSEGVTSSSRAALPLAGQESTARSSNLRAASTAQSSELRAVSTAHTRLAPAPQPLNSLFAPELGSAAELFAAGLQLGAKEESPASEPGFAPHDDAAVHEEAPVFSGGASSPAFLAGEVLHAEDSENSGYGAELNGAAILELEGKGKQAEACSTGRIHFDSVDGVLEASILRHVAQLSAAPVIVDRPGGVVHSERELRIVLPVTGNARADEAAAVAVEYGVLRGLLDLTRKPLRGELGEGGGEKNSRGFGAAIKKSLRIGKSKWWIFGGVLLAIALAVFGAAIDAASREDRGWNVKNTQPPMQSPDELRWGKSAEDFSLRGFVPSPASAETFKPTVSAAVAGLPALALRAAPPSRALPAAAQGQFATGQGGGGALDPCQVQTKSFVSINQTANTQLLAGTASKKIYVCSIHVVVAAATNVALVEGTGSVCATGTAGVSGFGGATAATGWNFMANGGISLGSGAASVGGEGTSADNLCLFNSGSGQVSGGISYVVQ
jgi:hypothetical protein